MRLSPGPESRPSAVSPVHTAIRRILYSDTGLRIRIVFTTPVVERGAVWQPGRPDRAGVIRYRSIQKAGLEYVSYSQPRFSTYIVDPFEPAVRGDDRYPQTG